VYRVFTEFVDCGELCAKPGIHRRYPRYNAVVLYQYGVLDEELKQMGPVQASAITVKVHRNWTTGQLDN
jgi:hypothetical protein